jgi:hypothetical protein
MGGRHYKVNVNIKNHHTILLSIQTLIERRRIVAIVSHNGKLMQSSKLFVPHGITLNIFLKSTCKYNFKIISKSIFLHTMYRFRSRPFDSVMASIFVEMRLNCLF